MQAQLFKHASVIQISLLVSMFWLVERSVQQLKQTSYNAQVFFHTYSLKDLMYLPSHAEVY